MQYIGSWNNGKQHGEMIFRMPGRQDKSGIWNEGIRLKWIDEDIKDNKQ